MNDDRLQVLIGNVLRAGVLISATVVAIAGVFYLMQHHGDTVGYSTFYMEPTNLRTLPGIVTSAMQFRAEAVIQFGLVLLIATPITRVALAAVAFYMERDRLYVLVSLIVLSILIFSITHAV